MKKIFSPFEECGPGAGNAVDCHAPSVQRTTHNPHPHCEQWPWVGLGKALQVILMTSQVGASETWRADVTTCDPCGLTPGVPQTFPGQGFALLPTRNKQKENLTSRSNI